MKHFFFVLFLLSFASLGNAATYEEMNQQVESFEKSGQARFAPATMKRVKAFQGASMLAAEEQSGFDQQDQPSNPLQRTIDKTLTTLNDAKNNALSFKQTFPELLNLEKQANKALVYHHNPQSLPEPNVQTLSHDAQAQMTIAISATEKGKLNQARQAAKKATIFFNKTIDAAMPGLIEQTERALSQARSTNAKEYAPKTYGEADQAFEQLETYAENIIQPKDKREAIPRPEKIGYALEMAVYSQKIAIKVKDWKRYQGTYEKLFLAAKQDRLNLAKAMHIPLDFDNVEVDISSDELLKHVQKIQHDFIQERQAHADDLANTNEMFQEKLEQRLHEQRLKDQQGFQAKVANIKASFNSKLERETFEKKRQQKVRDLFQKGEVEIIANLDGSLMIRAKKIRFGSNSSKVDGQYFDFLGRIKEALDLYPERNIIIEGHTDSSGDAKENRKLSLGRAEAVQEFLIAAGIDSERIKALGYGEVKPIATNMYKKGRALNRRIDIIIQAAQ